MTCLNSGCQGTAYSLSTRINELAQAKAREERAEERIRELESAITARTSSAELTRAREAIGRLQEIDVTQRRALDRANEEVSYMRQLLQTNKYDMEALEQLVGEHLRKTCGRAETKEAAEA